MPLETLPWDPAEHLDNEDDVLAYLNAALEDGDPALITAALGDVARSKGMTELAKRANLSRESLYRALSADGNPEFATIMRVLKALNLSLTIGQKEEKAA